jgi:hypothetical protein
MHVKSKSKQIASCLYHHLQPLARHMERETGRIGG